jgi:hypothetical protein
MCHSSPRPLIKMYMCKNLITFFEQQVFNLDGDVMEATMLVLSSSILLFVCFESLEYLSSPLHRSLV